MQSSAITNKPKSGLYHNLDYCRVLMGFTVINRVIMLNAVE